MERDITAGEAVTKKEPWTVKVAVWSARHRLPVLAGWLLLTV